MKAKKQLEIKAGAADSCPTTETHFTRREAMGLTGMAGLAALMGLTSSAIPMQPQKKVRIACLTTYWAATRSHADWIFTKLLDGYWWQGAYMESRVEVVSVYIHQLTHNFFRHIQFFVQI